VKATPAAAPGYAAAGLAAQVWLLRELLFEDNMVDEHSDQLFRSIVIGIMRLWGAATIATGVKALAAPADDSKILSPFREWVEAKRLSWAVPDDKEDEFEAAAEAADKIEDAILATRRAERLASRSRCTCYCA
jgi:hypothetical protein